ncbi:alpha/beta hydrolase [Halolamina sp. CBA1230]|uniref:alpha/beta fold hydrolase n=1 Tax=Halolamina sp. CBA1230 TaxID=1853690 RepID=UPI0009A14EDF|nr:alpha/beta hydrolase [Halolamina sp. CBA1230]QKY20084.1 alpha/beta hydrolase [Halolamina sp. CBA1230]
MRTHTVSRPDGPAIHVAESGPTDAPAVLFLHGYSLSHLSWRDQLRSSLADRYRFVAMDLRGHGDSEKPDSGYRESEVWADDVQAVADALSLDSFALVGWSYGSLVALDYLAVHGTDRVRGANLVGIVLGIGTPRTTEWLGPDYLDLFPDIVSTDAETATAALDRFVRICFHDRPSPEERYLLLGTAAATPPFVRDAMRDRERSHVDALVDLSLPVLLTHGAHDAVVDADAARAAAERLPDAELSIYPDTGHSPFREATERYNHELGEFLDDLD